MVPPSEFAQLNTELYSCRVCRAQLIEVDGNIACPACEGSAKPGESEGSNPPAKVSVATMVTSPPIAGGEAYLRDCTNLVAAMGMHIARCRWLDVRAGEIGVLPLEPDTDAYHQLAGAIADVTGLSDDELSIWISARDRELFVYAYTIELDVLRRRDASAESHAAEPVASTTAAAEANSATEAADEIDRADGVATEVEERAEAAMRDLFIATQDETNAAIREGRVPSAPMVLVDQSLRALARMRADCGEPPAHIARDPLAALVSELRHGRVPPTFVRVIRAMAVAIAEAGEPAYDDGHQRGHSAYSLVWLCCELAEYVALVIEGEEPVQWTTKGIRLAGTIAGQLVHCRVAYALDEGPIDDAKRAEIASRADEFIAELTKAAHNNTRA